MNNDTTPCPHCNSNVSGDEGHKALSFYVDGPFPGQRIFRCIACDERWIKHCGPEGGTAWTRYSARFSVRKPMPNSMPLRRALV
jgi:hypothetical protein